MDQNVKQIASQRVNTLFQLANKTYKQDPHLAQRYVLLARKIAMAGKIRLPKQYRLQVCRHCKSFIHAGANSRIRIQQEREPHIVITCLNCGKHMRIPLRKRRKHAKCQK